MSATISYMRAKTAIFLILLEFSLCFASLSAFASGPTLGVAGDIGLGGTGGEASTTLQTGFDLQEGKVALGLFGRLRILIKKESEGGGIRKRDWDEASDFVHILRNFQFTRSFANHSSDPMTLRFQAGELLGTTFGHGTLMRDYSSIADPDHPHAGLLLDLSSRRFRFLSALDNFIHPRVIANRLEVAPIASATEFRLGASLMFDPQAPELITLDESGARLIDPAYNLQASSRVLGLGGVDVEYAFGEQGDGQLKPYLDLNTSFYGLGFHAGTLGEVTLGKSSVRLFGQAEYRLGSAGYAATYFDTFYDIERFQASLSFSDPQLARLDDRSTKLAGVIRGAYGGQGFLTQAGLAWSSHLQMKVGLSYRPGPDPWMLWWRASSNPLPRLNLGCLLLVRDLDSDYAGANGIAAMVEGRYRLTDNLYTLMQYTRTWTLNDASHYFDIFQSFNISIGANWSG